MTTTTQIDLVINKLTSAQYASATKNANELYLTTDGVLSSSDVTSALGYTPVNPTSLTTKADTDLTNVTDNGTALGGGWALPSDTYENLTLGASDSTYTAPANGWLYLSKSSNANNQSIEFRNYGASGGSTGVIGVNQTRSNSGKMQICLPVKKDDEVTITYSAGGTTHGFRFIYAVGSEWEDS